MAGVNNSSETGGGFVGWFIRNHVAANLVMILFIGGGLLAVFGMRTELFPAIDPRMITVTVPYPGATPHEVEDGITRRVEEAVMGIEGVEKITSVAQENMGVITLEIEDFVNATQVLDDVENAVDRLVDFPPVDAEDPTVTHARPRPFVVNLAVYGDVPEHVLKRWAKRIESEMLRMPGISMVELRGDREYEISIEIPEDNLRKYDLTMQEVGQIVEAFSINLPAGTVESKSGDLLLRIDEKGYTAEGFEEIIVRSNPDGSLLRLKDISAIDDGFRDDDLIALYNGEPAIFIEVFRSEAQDLLEVETAVMDYLAEIRLPEGIGIEVMENRTEILKQRMNLLLRNALMGYALVFLVLFLFLDLKLAFWTSLGIVISFLGGLLIVFFSGMSFNMITLFALIVVLGIVVDDAIVTGESIFSEQQSGKEDEVAAISGVRAIRAPVTVGVLTTVAAFAPLAFTSGTLGQIMRPIPIFVISILMVSLVEAFTILPAHLSSSRRWSRGIVFDISLKVNRYLEKFVEKLFLPVLRVAITWQYAVLAVFVAALIVIVGMVRGGFIRFIFFPQIEGDQVTATLIMPVGTPFEITRKNATHMLDAAGRVEEQFRKMDGASLFDSTSLLIGSVFADEGPGAGQEVEDTTSNRAELRIQLIDAPLRTVTAKQVENRLKEAIGTIPNVDELNFHSGLVTAGPDIEIEFAHQDVAVLENAAGELKEKLYGIDGVVEVADTLKAGKLEYVFELTPAGLAAGLTPGDLGSQLRNAFYGYEVQRLQRERSELRVMVRYPEAGGNQISDVQDFRVVLPGGERAPLGKMATIRQQRTYSEIIRVDGRRVVNVTADVDTRVTTPEDVLGFVMKRIVPEIKEENPGLSAGVAGQSEERRDDLASLFQNMAIALLIIFLMLGAQLGSYIQPLIIMAVIPFGMGGAIIGHLLLGFDLSFISLFGMVALTGVVINDSVVLIDYYNTQRRDEGQSSVDAVLDAVRRRFRPILLTTMTTTFALLPMLLETSIQAQFLIPMAVSLAFGLLFASFLLLFLLPILIRIVYDIRRLAGVVK